MFVLLGCFPLQSPAQDAFTAYRHVLKKKRRKEIEKGRKECEEEQPPTRWQAGGRPPLPLLLGGNPANPQPTPTIIITGDGPWYEAGRWSGVERVEVELLRGEGGEVRDAARLVGEEGKAAARRGWVIPAGGTAAVWRWAGRGMTHTTLHWRCRYFG